MISQLSWLQYNKFHLIKTEIMKKAFCLLFTLCCIAVVKSQYKITCGSQTFNITAKKLSSVKQVDPSTKTETTSTYYYSISNNKLQVWLQTGDTETRSFTLYEIERSAIDQKISGEIAEYDQQEYTEPVKTLYIKCAAGKKDVYVIGYVDWTEKPDKFSWSFININSYRKPELENLLKEINTWLKQ
jgi:hypothetical protein